MRDVFKQEAYILFYERTHNAEVSSQPQLQNPCTKDKLNSVDTKMRRIFTQWKWKISWLSASENCNVKWYQKLKGGTGEENNSDTVSEAPSASNIKLAKETAS